MARLTFPDEGSRIIYDPDTGRLLPAGTRVHLYLDDAATVAATDLTDKDGVPITVGYVQLDAYRRLPDFNGPNDQRDTLFAVVNNGPISPVYANTDLRLDALVSRVTAVESTAGGAIPLTQRGAANGVATLDGAGTIPDTQIPSTLTRDIELAAAVTAAQAASQPVDSDLTAIAALTTTAFGRSLLALTDAAAGRTALGLGTAATQATGAFDAAGAAAAAAAASQPLDSDLTAIAALTTTSYGRAFLALADAAAARTALALGTIATHDATEFLTTTAAASTYAPLPPTSLAVRFVDPTNGNDSNDGRSSGSAYATFAAAVTALTSSPGYGVVVLSPGQHPLTDTVTIKQGISVLGPVYGQMGGAAAVSGGAELVWNGPDDGRYAIVTAASTTADFTYGRLTGFRLVCGASKPGGGAYTLANGLYCRNWQNLATADDIHVKTFPGIGIYLDDVQASATNTMPGFVLFTRVWSTGNGTNLRIRMGYTSIKFDMCSFDHGGNITTDPIIIEPPAGTSSGRGGKDATVLFVSCKIEGQSGDANFVTMNTDATVDFLDCSFTRGSPGTKPVVNFTPASLGSVNSALSDIVKFRNCHVQGIPTLIAAASLTDPISVSSGTVSGGETNTLTWPDPKTVPHFTSTGTAYTATVADKGAVREMNNASANTFTVPPNSSVPLPLDTVLTVTQLGAGQTTIVAGAGVTIRTPSTLILRAQYSSVTLRQRAANEWVLAGDTT